RAAAYAEFVPPSRVRAVPVPNSARAHELGGLARAGVPRRRRMPPRQRADAAIHSRVARPDRRIAAARARRRPGSTAAPAPDTQDATVITRTSLDSVQVTPAAA